MEVRPLQTRVWHNVLEIIVDVIWVGSQNKVELENRMHQTCRLTQGLLIILLAILALQEVFEDSGLALKPLILKSDVMLMQNMKRCAMQKAY